MQKPIKRTNYTKFNDIEEANFHARAIEKDLQTIFEYAQKSPQVYTGTTAPAITPLYVGDIFVNTVLAKVYISTGITASTDWKILN